MREYKHGGDIYSNQVRLDFSANINPLGIPEGVQEAAQKAVADCIHYPDPYCRELTAAIAKKERVPESFILCGNGAADLIYRFVVAMKPQRAVILAPGFSEYEDALRAMDCEVQYHFLQEELRFRLTEEFLSELTEDIDVVFLCNPNNPTGQLIDQGLLKRILARCKEQKIFIFLDECFLDFVKEGDKHSLKKELQTNDTILILRAFTKMYAMAGLRLGYCICNNRKVLDSMVKCSQSWAISIPAQAAGLAALREKAYVKKTIEMIEEERNYLIEELYRLEIHFFPPTANYIFLKSEKDLYALLIERGILIRSCHNYPGLGYGYYRIAVKSHEDNSELIKALECIEKGDL